MILKTDQTLSSLSTIGKIRRESVATGAWYLLAELVAFSDRADLNEITGVCLGSSSNGTYLTQTFIPF